MSRHVEPCPCCGHGNPGHEVRYVGGTVSGSRVRCTECGVTGPWGDGLDEAAERWNAMPRREETDGPDH